MADKKTESSREGKVYALKSSAQRAAKEDGLLPNQFELVEVKKPREGWKYVYSEAYKAVKDQMPAKEPMVEIPPPEKLVKDLTPAEVEKVKEVVAEKAKPRTAKEAFENDLKEIQAMKLAETIQVEDQTEVVEEKMSTPPVAPGQPPITSGKPAGPMYVCPECKAHIPGKTELAKHRLEAHNVKPKAKDSWLHKSQVESPTKAVWEIAEQMKKKNPNVSRKEVIAECERQGIAHWTARTQYQTWLTAKRESDANAAKVNGKK